MLLIMVVMFLLRYQMMASRRRGPWGSGRSRWPGQNSRVPPRAPPSWPGGGPAGGGRAVPGPGPGGDASVPAGPGRGAGARLAGSGAPWPGAPRPGAHAPDWLSDPRPAAASVPAELFPVDHARAVQASHPLDVGLAAIKAHDPAFDLEQFTQRAQQVFFTVQQGWVERNPDLSRRVMADGLWQAQRFQVQSYLEAHRRNVVDNLAVANIWPVAASCSSSTDVVTVRILAACTDYDVDDATGAVVRGDTEVRSWAEDWTFQRSSSAVTRPGGTTMGERCPNCGAPLDVDIAGSCRYCKAPIMSGDYDWVLARISQVG